MVCPHPHALGAHHTCHWQIEGSGGPAALKGEPRPGPERRTGSHLSSWAWVDSSRRPPGGRRRLRIGRRPTAGPLPTSRLQVGGVTAGSRQVARIPTEEMGLMGRNTQQVARISEGYRVDHGCSRAEMPGFGGVGRHPCRHRISTFNPTPKVHLLPQPQYL
jgi:hypothetical protein